MEEADKEAIIEELLNDNSGKQNKINQLSLGLSGYDQSTQSPNLIHYQVDSSDLLERLEHFYKGEYLTTDEDGNVVWKVPEDPEQIPLNSFGVSSLMEIVSKYIDKNTTLSNYSEMRINEILADLGDELILFILCNHRKMGMDTNFKKTKFRLLVVTTLHIIESTYRRAIGGRTFEDVNQSRIITQSDSPGLNRLIGFPNVSKKNNGNWFKRMFA